MKIITNTTKTWYFLGIESKKLKVEIKESFSRLVDLTFFCFLAIQIPLYYLINYSKI
jgi:hypothetical protein